MAGLRGFMIILFLLLCVSVSMHVAYGVKDRPALFIFGDSTADVGTNNFLRTTAKANVPFNGIDFLNSKPTGRFSNGLNTIDHIARLFGYKKSPPPFLALKKNQQTFKENILRGVNFASGGSGILRNTGRKLWGEVIFFEKQVQQFAFVRSSIIETLGHTDAATYLSKALFVISVGGNDLLDFAGNNTGLNLGQKQYLAALQSTYYNHIWNLYSLGARKFGILSVAPIGCCPAIRVASYGINGGECVDELNQFASVFNSATEALLQRLSYELKDFKYSFGNTIAMTMPVLQHPSAFGFKDTKTACCGDGKLNGEAPCIKANNPNLCADRKAHLFWDWFHPTERASQLAASTLYGGAPQFVTPINFSQLALL